jgi:hypothetical protein
LERHWDVRNTCPACVTYLFMVIAAKSKA